MNETRKHRASTRTNPHPYPEGGSLYLNGATRRAPLTLESEAELARRIEEGEWAMLRALCASRVGLAELGAIGRELAEGRLDPQDVWRSGDRSELGREQSVPRLAAALQGAAGPAAEALRLLLDSGGDPVTPGRAGLHRRVLDRAARALHEAPVDHGTRREIAAVEAARRIADRARSELVDANLGLVISLAKRRLGRGLPFHDLVQEGNLGLMRAADKYDHRRGLRFGTYATWWVRQQIARAILDQTQTIRVPVHLAEARMRMRRVERAFEQAHGRTPSELELGEASGLHPSKVRRALAIQPEPVSLETPVGTDQEGRLGDSVADPTAPAPDDELAQARLREETKRLMGRLSPREQLILRRRFGIDDVPEQTLAEIGASLSISRERVRQIEAEALRKLRAPSQAEGLDTYLSA